MESRVFALCLLVVILMQAGTAFARSSEEYRLEADQYYLEQNFKKAHRIYYKLAKEGDHHSQCRLSSMYASGEGKKIDLSEAYAWAVLAAEGGDE
jgi:TPR repeat protein